MRTQPIVTATQPQTNHLCACGHHECYHSGTPFSGMCYKLFCSCQRYMPKAPKEKTYAYD